MLRPAVDEQPRGTLAAGLLAMTRMVSGSLAERTGWQSLGDWAGRPSAEFARLQAVHLEWWRERAARPAPPDAFHYLALGDSTAQGIGASTPGRSYVGQLADRIEGALGEPIRVTNLSISGATSHSCFWDQLPLARRLLTDSPPDLVTIDIGANDVAWGDPVSYHRHLGGILDALPAHTIVGEVPCFHLPHNERKVFDLNGILHTLAEDRGLRVVPVHEATRRRGIPGILTEFAADAFHPNDRGYQVWADAFWPFAARRLAAVRAAGSTPGAGALQGG